MSVESPIGINCCQTSFENFKPSNFSDLVNNCTVHIMLIQYKTLYCITQQALYCISVSLQIYISSCRSGQKFESNLSSLYCPVYFTIKSSQPCTVYIHLFRSPSVTIDPTRSSKKTPVKFDLQASLKKPLKYKPHTGKIKAVYFADRRSVEPNKRISTNKSFTGEPEQKQSVKEITKNVTSR